MWQWTFLNRTDGLVRLSFFLFLKELEKNLINMVNNCPIAFLSLGLLSEIEQIEMSESEVDAGSPSPILGAHDSATVAATIQGIIFFFCFLRLLFPLYFSLSLH